MLVAVKCCTCTFSLCVSTCILLKAMFRAASFGGHFALLVARHLYLSVFRYYLLIHWANKICSVLFKPIETLSSVMKHLQKVVCFILFIYSQAFHNNVISNGKSYCFNVTFTDVRFTSLLAKNI